MLPTHHAGKRKHRFGRSLGLILLLLAFAAPLVGSADGEQVFVPIGGGYSETTLQGYARVVIEHMDGGSATADIKVVPSTYGTSLDAREANIELAQTRTDQVEAACHAVVPDYPAIDDCQAELLMLFDRDQANDPTNSAGIADAETDGVFILGGDQTIAMEVLADTPAESTMAAAYASGVVFGGTSAGAAMQSQTMPLYTSTGWPYNALEKNQIMVWWGDDAGHERGLSFGSDSLLVDQHFYQRGRITRSLNTIAQSDERFGGASLLGLGMDYQTGVSVSDDSLISGVVGDSSVMVIDGESLDASFAFVGPRETLSARNIVTHLLAEDDVIAYDIAARQPLANGAAVTPGTPVDWDAATLDYAGNATLVLGGDLSFDWTGPAMAAFVEPAQASGLDRIVVMSTAFQSNGKAKAAAEEYAAGLQQAGWTGSVETVAFKPKQAHEVDPSILDSAAGVVFVGGDQAHLSEAPASAAFGSLVNYALDTVPVVLADRAMTAAFGDRYVTNADPTDDNYQGEGIAAFQTDYVTTAPGLGVVGGAFEPRNTWHQRWGRLYSIVLDDPLTIAFGISEMTAIVFEPGSTPVVVGERSVAALDGRMATPADGDNGAFTLLNVVMDLFAPGDALASDR